MSLFPSDFKRLAYIESTGTQYIDTGFTPNQDTKTVMDMEVLSTTPSVSVLFGARSSTKTSPYYGVVFRNAAMRSDYGTSQNSVTPNNVYKRTTIVQGKDGFSFGEYTTQNPTSTFTCTASMYLFCYNNGYASIDSPVIAKLYSCQIYDNGTLVRDYIPCKNASGEIGLYDMVSGVFYGNSGTGTFYGVEARKLPEGYTQTEYIESTGTQYIDTGFKPKSQNVQIFTDFMYTDTHTSSSLFGAETSNPYLIVAYGAPKFYVGGSSGLLTQDTEVDTRYKMLAHANNGTFSVTLNGVKESASYTGNLETGYNLYLFANNISGTTKEYISARIYASYIYDNGTLVRDYVPCINNSGAAGLYDLVNGKFYTNAGTGTFATGSTIEPLVPDAPQSFKQASATENSVTLSWGEVDYCTGYKLYKNGVLISTQSGTTYTDSIEPFTEYTYTVTAYYADWESPTTALDVTIYLAPETPTGLAEISRTPPSVTIAWNTAEYATGYNVYRDGELLATQAGTEYTDTLPTSGVYQYGVEAYNEHGNSAPAMLSITIQLCPPCPSTFCQIEQDGEVIALEWSAVECKTYKLFRNGRQIAETPETSYIDEACDCDMVYTYALTAVDEYGESEAITTFARVALGAPITPVLYMITDRTIADTMHWLALRNKGYANMTEAEKAEWDAANMKGAYNPPFDMNRVGEALNYIRDRLAEANYLAPSIFTAKTDWTDIDIPTAADLTAYLGYVSVIREAMSRYSTTPKTPANTGGLDHQEANNIEQILIDVDQLITNMLAARYFCNELYCGEI